MPRFTILEHDHPALHWDFLLESGDVLRAWRLLARPVPDRNISAEASFDHRRLYLDYEGPVSGGRGSVKRWDGGDYRLESEAPGRLLLWLDGGCVRGRVVLERESSGDGWCFRLSLPPAVAASPGP